LPASLDGTAGLDGSGVATSSGLRSGLTRALAAGLGAASASAGKGGCTGGSSLRRAVLVAGRAGAVPIEPVLAGSVQAGPCEPEPAAFGGEAVLLCAITGGGVTVRAGTLPDPAPATGEPPGGAATAGAFVAPALLGDVRRSATTVVWGRNPTM
jgi:hypothetical protein